MGTGGLFGCRRPWFGLIDYLFLRRPKNLKQSSGGMYGFYWQCLLFGLPGMYISRLGDVKLPYLIARKVDYALYRMHHVLRLAHECTRHKPIG
jgi:hypothetical protein